MAAIKNNSPTSDHEHAEAMTSNALEIDATDDKNLKSDIESGNEDIITGIDLAEGTALDVKEIKKILGTTKVTIIIDLTGAM